MQDKKYLIIIYVSLVGVISGSTAFVYVLLPQAGQKNLMSPGTNLEQPKPKAEVHLYKKQGALVLAWANLPDGTERVDIFRSVRGTNKWEKWKSFTITSGSASGDTIEIPVSSREDLALYSFYAQAVGTYIPGSAGSGGAQNPFSGSPSGPAMGDGAIGAFLNEEGESVLWVSMETELETYVPPPPPAPAQPGAPNQSQTSTPTGNEPPSMIIPILSPGSTSSPASPASSSSAPQTTPAQAQPGTPGQAIYYAPNGTISGYGSAEPAASFWVEHVNKNIEIGWQGIPASTTLAIVYRSSSETGPWSELLRQTGPHTSYLIRLIDNTLDRAFYYKMAAREGTTVLQTYGPLFLPALE